ncbi:Septin-domain-containing protein [Pisolithus marmoratus]|nr:Septin-domain-containing protein [Pisolithus marmoratus]
MSFAGRRRGNKIKKGVQFTLMVVGASGTGHTTFVNTLCDSEVLAHKLSNNPDTTHIEEGIRIKPVNVELEEDGVCIALTIVDTPGFGDNIDNNFQEIAGYLECQYSVLHPTHRSCIMEDIEHYDIPIYNFPYDIEEDDEETIQDNSELRALLPFAIIGSEEALEVEGQSIRARRQPWGEIYNLQQNRRVKAWSDLPAQKKNQRDSLQLSWEAEVVEYVNFLWQKTWPRKKTANEPAAIGLDVPILGPRFLPPTYLHTHKQPGLSSIVPEMRYLKPINVVHPFYYPELTCCPQCLSSDAVTWEGWTGTGACEVHGIFYEEVALGLQLRCNGCKAKSSGNNLRERSSERHTEIEDDIQHRILEELGTLENTSWHPNLFPLMRCAIAEQIKQLHLLEYQRWKLEYLDQLQHQCSKPKTVAAYFGRSNHLLTMFSPFVNLQGYAGRPITDEMVSEVYLSFVSKTRQQESESYLRTLTAVCGSLDSTFKVSSKASLTDKDCQHSKHLKGGILSVLNEDNQIVSWRFCQSKSNAEIMEVLMGLKQRTELLGKTAPEMIVSDNCCAVRSALLAVFPQVDSIQDVWHFIARYLATIMNASKNPLRSAVMADITNAILKKHAKDGGSGAEYWSRLEQEEWLIAAYDKWSESGTVWSAASLKVHQEQLKHIQKGCLERRRQDILSDGSRIEGCHKAWNLLQRAQPSGLVMLTALSHDFVLQRNVRIASESANVDPFILSTHGSHHLHLSSAIAECYN